MLQKIQYIKHEALNTKAYNQCIASAENGSIYAYSWYLDLVAKNWDALVFGDYEYVMPLPWRKKYGFYYLYMPIAIPCLGVFGNTIQPSTVISFLQAIPKKFRFWDITLNRMNAATHQNYKLFPRTNFILDLNQDYNDLYNNYRQKNVQKNIKKAADLKCEVVTGIPVKNVIALIEAYTPGIQIYTPEDFQNLETLYNKLFSKQKAITYGIIDRYGDLLASGIFFFSHNRAYYVFAGNHPNGRTLGASHALLDAFIRDHATTDLLLDFEGSDINSLAFFYGSFGATKETYYHLRLNRLPWLGKLLLPLHQLFRQQ